MCGICAAIPAFSPECVYTGTQNNSAVTEGADWGATAGSAGSMQVNGTATGTLGTGTDIDWIAVTLTAGETYEITLEGIGSSPVADTYLRIFDGASRDPNTGTLIAQNDDANGLNSGLTLTASTSGTYFIDVRSFGGRYDGDYRVTVQQNTLERLPEFTVSEIATQLNTDFWGGTQRAWNTSGNDIVAGDQDGNGDGRNDNIVTFNVSTLSATYQDYARTSFDTWSDIANIQFVEVTGTADITFQDSDLGSAYASSSTRFSASGVREITSTTINVGSDWQALTSAEYTLQTFIHEIGHALGLGHAGDYNGSGRYSEFGTGDNSYVNDSWQATVMSYFSQSEATAVDASFAYLLTPMLADVLAIRELYGAATDTRLGNTTYGFNNNTGDFFDLDGYSSNANYNYALTLTDSGGFDTLNLSGSSLGATISLVGGTASSIMGETGNLFIANGTVIERVIGTSARDVISGNSAANVLSGGGGNDVLLGGAGADVLNGGSGFDRVQYSDSTTGLRVDLINSNANTGIASGDTFTNIEGLFGSRRNDVLLGDNAANAVWGANGSDVIYGRGGADVLFGGNGADVLVGGVGADVLNGGSGFDRVQYSDSTAGLRVDLITPNANTGIASGDTFTSIEGLFGSHHNDVLLGTNAANAVWGWNGNDVLNGRGGNDRLIGGGGNDRLFGGGGNDRLSGGNGADVLVGGAGADVLNGGSGFDRVQYSDSTTGLRVDLIALNANTGIASGDTFTNIEGLFGSGHNDVLLGNNAANAVWGANGSDVIYGRGGNDRLFGGGGNDRLIGGGGNDRLIGGAGSDDFNFAGAFGNDVIIGFNAADNNEDINLAAVSTITSWTDLSTAANGHLYNNANGFAVIDDLNGNTITLQNVSVASLDVGDFIF